MEKFLKIDNKYFSLAAKGFKSIDILVLAKISEFSNKELPCYMTNEQFSLLFGDSVSTIKRVLDRLEQFNLIKRQVFLDSNNGQASRVRVLFINKEQLKMQLELCAAKGRSKYDKVGPKNEKGRSKYCERSVHIEPKTNNKTDNKTNNILINVGITEEDMKALKRKHPFLWLKTE